MAVATHGGPSDDSAPDATPDENLTVEEHAEKAKVLTEIEKVSGRPRTKEETLTVLCRRLRPGLGIGRDARPAGIRLVRGWCA
jgi:hypothetical protein